MPRIPDLAKITISIILAAGAYAFSKGHPALPPPELPRAKVGEVALYCEGGVLEGDASASKQQQLLRDILKDQIEYRAYELIGTLSPIHFKDWDVRQLSDTGGEHSLHFPVRVLKTPCRSVETREEGMAASQREMVCCAFLKQR